MENIRAVRSGRVFTDAQSKSASALFYSYTDHHRKSSGAEIRFVYGISGSGEIGENAISLPRARRAAFCATEKFPAIPREIGYDDPTYANEQESAFAYGRNFKFAATGKMRPQRRCI